MKVRCVANTGESLPLACLDDRSGPYRATRFPLTVGRTYVVHAVTVRNGVTMYFVMDDNGLAYPVWRPAPLFTIESGSVPDGWALGHVRLGEQDVGYPMLSFPEWANDRFFYERLVEGDSTAVAVFERWRLLAEAAE